MALLDCRDTRISLWQSAGVVHSPGFVLLDGGDFHFGQPALEQWRLRPRDSNSRFWWQLSTQPLKPALGAARHTADLVHSHLRQVHAEAGLPDALTLAVPDSMPREQLSLLLGVAQACDFEVAGLVSRSVLLASTAIEERPSSGLLHVEAQLNQAIVNELRVEDGNVSLSRSTPLPACGLLALQERLISAIASAFIQQTRFDPRRSATSEQALYNQLRDILEALRERGEASIDIDGHRARVSNATLEGASQRLLEGLAEAQGSAGLPLLLDPEFAALPGVDALAKDGFVLTEASLWDAWQVRQSQVELGQDEVHLIDRLTLEKSAAGTSTGAAAAPKAAAPASVSGSGSGSGSGSDPKSPSQGVATEAAPESSSPQTKNAVATHVLVDTRALPLRGAEVALGSGFALRSAGGVWTLHGDGALINGIPSTPAQPLALGDTLSLGAAGHGRLIEVLE